jgi:hypothetical protein
MVFDGLNGKRRVKNAGGKNDRGEEQKRTKGKEINV